MAIRDVRVAEGLLTFIWAFDLGAFVEGQRDIFRLARSEDGWLDSLGDVLRKAAATGRLSASASEIDHSKFELANERVGASTLAAQQARGQMPLRIPARKSSWAEGGFGFEWRLASASIGAQGAAAVRYEARLVKGLLAEAVIEDYHGLIQLLRADLTKVVQEALGLLTAADGPLNGVSFRVPSGAALEPHLIGYESFDTDLELLDHNGEVVEGPIKSFLREEELDCVRQLAALSRMTRTEPDHYNWERLGAFQRADIGNREDELWIVNSHRMLRCHPERHDERIKWFYEDVLCLAELSVQQLASLEYTDQWLGEARASLRRRMNAPELRETVAATGEVLRSIEAVTDLIVQPHSLTLGVRHPFFRKLADRLIDELGLRTTGEQVQGAADLFLNVASAVFSHDVSVSSQTLDRANAEVGRSMHRLTVVTAVAAILALVISAAALFRGSDTHTPAKSFTTTTKVPPP